MQFNLNEFKEKQKTSIVKSDLNQEDEIYTGNLYHDYFRIIPFNKMKRLIDKNSITLNGSKLLLTSVGTGIDYFYLKKIFNLNADVTATDISEDAINYVKKLYPEINPVINDTENLSYEDNYFDFSYVANSLHHLPRPHLGLYELIRVSKKGVIVIEPHDSFLTRLFVKLGFAHDVEISGNYVFRYTKREVEKITKSLFVDCTVVRFFATHYQARNSIEFFILKLLNLFLNLVCPFWGNYIIFLVFQKNK